MTAAPTKPRENASAAPAGVVNVPAVGVPRLDTGHRMGFLHVNVPGVLAEVNALLASEGDNVIGQHLATRGELGYVVTDATNPLSAGSLERLRSSENCRWVRTW